MQIAKVLGTVVSTDKDPSLQGVKFLVLQFIDKAGNPLEGYEVAADTVGAGVDEWVLVSRGSQTRHVRDCETRPIDAAVIAIIDTVNVGSHSVYSKRDEAYLGSKSRFRKSLV
ncbi:MAG: EutN/CcmL family microcompartment protein [Synechococcales cyanobacterium RU_4_20]|nr:EutN/CcmL family microcompartment protein [Synechococcales cyanobacterium RU_4_20]NJR68931.1 EutN/CcmL family microcompartment protein [Synechococcales cyanobacterium CRU_2_2]